MRVHRSLALLVCAGILALLLAACSDGRTVTSTSVSEPLEDGTRTYTVRVRGDAVEPDATFARTVPEDAPWVRHCFNRATVGESVPYYCISGRTVLAAWLGFLTAAAATGGTWFATRVAGVRVPRPASVPPLAADAWLFLRTEADKQAHQPVWDEHFRMSTRRHAAKAGLLGLAGALVLTSVASLAGPRWIAEWAMVSGILHFMLFALVLGWLSWHRDHLDEVMQTRLLLSIGIGLGLVLAGIAFTPWETVV
jgi:hypothetical protein